MIKLKISCVLKIRWMSHKNVYQMLLDTITLYYIKLITLILCIVYTTRFFLFYSAGVANHGKHTSTYTNSCTYLIAAANLELGLLVCHFLADFVSIYAEYAWYDNKILISRIINIINIICNFIILFISNIFIFYVI